MIYVVLSLNPLSNTTTFDPQAILQNFAIFIYLRLNLVTGVHVDPNRIYKSDTQNSPY